MNFSVFYTKIRIFPFYEENHIIKNSYTTLRIFMCQIWQYCVGITVYSKDFYCPGLKDTAAGIFSAISVVILLETDTRSVIQNLFKYSKDAKVFYRNIPQGYLEISLIFIFRIKKTTLYDFNQLEY